MTLDRSLRWGYTGPYTTGDIMETAILDTFGRASAWQFVQGRNWYPTANHEATVLSSRYGVPVRTVANVIAALSPRLHWHRNLDWARAVITAHAHDLPAPRFGLGRSLDNALRALDGFDTATEGSIKVRNFAQNIIGNHDAVTIDVWAARVAGLEGRLTEARYAEVADAYREAANILNIPPAVVQATTWIVKRGRNA